MNYAVHYTRKGRGYRVVANGQPKTFFSDSAVVVGGEVAARAVRLARLLAQGKTIGFFPQPIPDVDDWIAIEVCETETLP